MIFSGEAVCPENQASTSTFLPECKPASTPYIRALTSQKSDSSAAPEGKDSLTILVPIGHMLLEDHRTSEDWTGLVAKARGQVMDVMEGRLGMQKGELEKAIVWEDVNTPVTCKFVPFLRGPEC